MVVGCGWPPRPLDPLVLSCPPNHRLEKPSTAHGCAWQRGECVRVKHVQKISKEIRQHKNLVAPFFLADLGVFEIPAFFESFRLDLIFLCKTDFGSSHYESGCRCQSRYPLRKACLLYCQYLPVLY